MLKSNQDKVPQGRVAKETRLEVDEWFLDVTVTDDDEPEPPPGGRSLDLGQTKS